MNTSPLLFALEPHPLQQSLCRLLPAEEGRFSRRQFPDGESYIRVDSKVEARHCIVLADLSHPDGKFLPLVFLVSTLRELGAVSIGLIAPYLSYMRQDRRFVDGEAVTSKWFAAELSRQVDWLVTVDPHLHRYQSLDEIYNIPSRVVQGAPALAEWLSAETNLLLVGPDAESEQWVSDIASRSGHPFVIGKKIRSGDRDVQVTLPDLSVFTGRDAMIIDDVISSGQTIRQCALSLILLGMLRVRCAAVHGIFADGADQALLDAGIASLVTTNTIAHSSNGIDIAPLLLEPVHALSKT